MRCCSGERGGLQAAGAAAVPAQVHTGPWPCCRAMRAAQVAHRHRLSGGAPPPSSHAESVPRRPVGHLRVAREQQPPRFLQSPLGNRFQTACEARGERRSSRQLRAASGARQAPCRQQGTPAALPVGSRRAAAKQGGHDGPRGGAWRQGRDAARCVLASRICRQAADGRRRSGSRHRPPPAGGAPVMLSLAQVGSSGSTPGQAPASWPSDSARDAVALRSRSCTGAVPAGRRRQRGVTWRAAA